MTETTPLLWVEDDAALRRLTRGLLRAEGFDVAEAEDAAGALAAARFLAAQKPGLYAMRDVLALS